MMKSRVVTLSVIPVSKIRGTSCITLQHQVLGPNSESPEEFIMFINGNFKTRNGSYDLNNLFC